MCNDEYTIAVYPFHKQVLPCLSFRSINKRALHFKSLITPDGFGFDGCDASILDNRPKVGLVMTQDFQKGILECDTLFCPHGDYAQWLQDDCVEKMLFCANRGMNIFCASDIPKEYRNTIQKICKKHGSTYLFAEDMLSNEGELLGDLSSEYQRQHFMTPVVCVGEMICGTNGEDIAIMLSNYFEKQGYHARVLLPYGNATIFGAHSFEYVFRNSKDNLVDLANKLKSYIYQLDDIYSPDIFIIKLPGSILKLQDEILNDYGIFSYITSQILEIDYFTVCAPYFAQSDKHFIDLINQVEQKLNVHIDSMHMSNAMMDTSQSNTSPTHSLDWIYLSETEYRKPLCDSNRFVYNVFADDAMLCNVILKKLEQYGASIVV